MLKIKRLALISLLSLLVCGCGFQLRHAMVMHTQFQPLYLQSNEPFSLLIKQFKQELASAGVVLSDNPNNSRLILQILHADTRQQLTNTSANNQVSQYLRTFSVAYQILSPNGRLLLGPLTVSASRNITLIANQILSDTYNINQIQQDLHHEVIVKMLYRLKSPASLRYINHETTL